jgi:hypothetical protein
MMFSVATALTVNSIQYAEATKAKGSSGHVPPKRYGSANKYVVCGDKLCSEVGG